MITLRQASFPFDWLTAAELAPRLDLLLNEFEDFLNLEDLRYMEKPAGIVGDPHCDNYQNVRNGFFYYHDFPAGSELDQAYPDVKEKYNRRVERLLSLLNSNKTILFVWYAHEPLLSGNEEIVKYGERLAQKYGKRIDLLIIENDQSLSKDDYKLEHLSPGVRKVLANTYPDDKEHITLGNVKLGDRIFNEQCLLRYKPWPLFRKAIQKRFIRLACLFIFFDKDLRRAFRKKYSR
jgi:hypothetical protein